MVSLDRPGASVSGGVGRYHPEVIQDIVSEQLDWVGRQEPNDGIGPDEACPIPWQGGQQAETENRDRCRDDLGAEDRRP